MTSFLAVRVSTERSPQLCRCGSTSQANASRQNLPFCFTPVFLEVLLQRIRPLRRSSERSPSDLPRRGPRSLDWRQDEASSVSVI